MVSTRTNSERNNREFANRRYYGNSRISCRIEQSIYNRNQIQMVDPGYVDFSDNDVKFDDYWDREIYAPANTRNSPPFPPFKVGRINSSHIISRKYHQHPLGNDRRFVGSSGLPPPSMIYDPAPPPGISNRYLPRTSKLKLYSNEFMYCPRNNLNRNNNRKRITSMIHNIDKNGKKSSKNNSGRMKKYLQNYYQMDKPWVTDIIREKFKKKEELYDKLKGRQDAKLFAEFKLTKNEFAKLYKEARTKFEEGTLSKDNKTIPNENTNEPNEVSKSQTESYTNKDTT